MSTRLNQKTRSAVVDAAIQAAGFPERRLAAERARNDWEERVRIHALGGEEMITRMRKASAQIDNLLREIPESLHLTNPFGGLDQAYARLNICGRVTTVEYRRYDEGTESWVTDRRLSPYAITLAADHPLATEWQQLESAEEVLDDAESTLRAEVRALVGSVSTTRRLLEVWPEAEDLLPKPEVIAALPAVQIDTINNHIAMLKRGDDPKKVFSAGAAA